MAKASGRLHRLLRQERARRLSNTADRFGRRHGTLAPLRGDVRMKLSNVCRAGPLRQRAAAACSITALPAAPTPGRLPCARTGNPGPALD